MEKEVGARAKSREILFEGFREEDILSLPKEDVDQLIFVGEPIVFRVGSAAVLGSFKVAGEQLTIELAQIEGGGEGVLPALASLARRYAVLHGLLRVEWIVHAVSCAKPNLKLRRVLIKQITAIGEAYYFLDNVETQL